MREKMVEKIHGCLVGLATGDAMGMPGLSSYRRTVEIHGAELTTFITPVDDPAIDPVHYLLPKGTVTDDTFGALAIVDAIVSRGEISLDTFVQSNINWVTYADELSYELGRNRGLAGPSTSAAIEKLRGGMSPYETGKHGVTNGSAARVPPIGFLYPGDLEATVDAAELSCIPTHNTNVAISATAAVACAISVIAAGETAINAIIDAAKQGAEMGKAEGISSTALRSPKGLIWLSSWHLQEKTSGVPARTSTILSAPTWPLMKWSRPPSAPSCWGKATRSIPSSQPSTSAATRIPWAPLLAHWSARCMDSILFPLNMPRRSKRRII